ncbi:MAG: putative Ig domain-containing protein, partial [Candidatus Methylacidiphilales bacterium]
ASGIKSLTFRYKDLAFDNTTQDTPLLAGGRVRDGFELALVGADGKSLLPVIGLGRDAFYYSGEKLATATRASGVTVMTEPSGEVLVHVSVAGLTPGTPAKLIARLVNDDGDTATEVKITAPTFATDAVTGPGAPLSLDPGAGNGSSELAWSQLAPIPAGTGVTTTYNTASWNEKLTVLNVEAQLHNGAAASRTGRYVVVVKDLSDPAVQVLQPDGLTPTGEPYFDFYGAMPTGTLAVGASSNVRTVRFFNPNGVVFNWAATVYAAPNKAPAWTSVPVVNAYFGAPYLYLGQAVDPESSTVTYSLVAGPGGMAIDSSTGRVTWTPPATGTADASYGVTLRAADASQATVDQSFTLTVHIAPPNRPPLVTVQPSVDVVAGSTYSSKLVATDPDGDALSYSVPFDSAPQDFSINASTGVVSWAPTVANVGTHAVKLQVDDGRGGVTTYSYSIVVHAAPETVNHAPIFVTTPPVGTYLHYYNSSTENLAYGFQYAARAIDPDGDTITYSSNEASVTEDGRIQIGFGYYVDEPFTWTGLITATDSRGASTSQQITVQVGIAENNQAPVITSTPRLTAAVGVLWQYQITASDPDGHGIQISASGDNPGITFDEATGVLSWTPTAADVGTTPSVYISVNDNVDSASQDFQLTVTATEQGQLANRKPTFTSVPTSGTTAPGAFWTYIPKAVDADADPLVFTLLAAPSNMRMDERTGSVVWTPDATQSGTYRAVLQVSDGRGGTDTQDLLVSTTLPTITAKNTAPVFLTPSLLDYYKIDFEGKNYRGQNLYVFFPDDPNVNLGGVPFSVGPQGGNNYWRSFETGLPNPRTVAFPVGVDGALLVETLINTGWGAAGPQSYAYLEFFGTKGAYYRKDLVGNEDIRNWNTGDGNFTRFINNTTTTLVYGFDYFGTFRAMDKQKLALPAEFQGQGLASMRLVDNGGDGFQRTFLGGVSVMAPGVKDAATIQAGIPFSYTFSAQDAEQSQLTYTLVSGPAGATVNSTSGLLTWTPGAVLSGWFPVVLRAADGQGGTAELNLTLRVQPSVYNYTPKITSQPMTKVRFGSTYRSLVQVYDPNGDPISYQLTQAPSGMTLVTR